jgi:hypothetical protein
MWNKLKKESSLCEQYGAELENLPLNIEGPQVTAELGTYVRVELAEHVASCARCKETGEVFWMTRELLRPGVVGAREGLQARVDEAKPWFAVRVMANIAEHEEQMRKAKTEWSGAVARLASRLALVSAALLLFASTWLYEPQDSVQKNGAQQQASVGASANGANSAEAPQYLFDSTTPSSNVNVYDALAGPGER